MIIATSALCLMLVAAVPLPSSDQEQTRDLEIVQIPLRGDKVSIFHTIYLIFSNAFQQDIIIIICVAQRNCFNRIRARVVYFT